MKHKLVCSATLAHMPLTCLSISSLIYSYIKWGWWAISGGLRTDRNTPGGAVLSVAIPHALTHIAPGHEIANTSHVRNHFKERNT